jgi:hypothetical protein
MNILFKKYVLLFHTFLFSFTVLCYNIFVVNSIFLLLLNYGIGLLFGYIISRGSNFILNRKLLKEQIIFIIFSGVLFIVYFLIKKILYTSINNRMLAEIFTVLINTFIFLIFYFKLYKQNVSIKKIIVGTLLIGSCTFWTELGFNKIYGISISFFGMFFWQIGISYFINLILLQSNGTDTTHQAKPRQKGSKVGTLG